MRAPAWRSDKVTAHIVPPRWADHHEARGGRGARRRNMVPTVRADGMGCGMAPHRGVPYGLFVKGARPSAMMARQASWGAVRRVVAGLAPGAMGTNNRGRTRVAAGNTLRGACGVIAKVRASEVRIHGGA